MKLCPSCDGAGVNVGYACGPTVALKRHESTCQTCEGNGQITEEHYGRVMRGREDRYQRVHVLGITLREQATRLFVDYIALSKWENHGIPWAGKR